MMKKTLFVFVVLALIAQICARPEDKEGDAAKTAQEQSEKAVKKGKDKAAEASEEAQDVARADADKAKESSDKLENKGEEAAENFGKHAHGHGGHGHGTETNTRKNSNVPKMSAVVRKAEQAGEKMIETGTNIFATMLENLGV